MSKALILNEASIVGLINKYGSLPKGTRICLVFSGKRYHQNAMLGMDAADHVLNIYGNLKTLRNSLFTRLISKTISAFPSIKQNSFDIGNRYILVETDPMSFIEVSSRKLIRVWAFENTTVKNALSVILEELIGYGYQVLK